MYRKLKLLILFVVFLVLFSVFIQPAFAQEKKKEDSKVSSQINGLRTTIVTTTAISTTGCSTAPYLGSLSCGGSKSGSGSLSSGATNWHKIYASSSGTLTVSLSGPSSADFDLYVYSSCSGSWICRPYLSSSNESCTINATSGSYYYIGINSYSGSGSYSISTSLSCGGGTTCNSSSYASCSSAAAMSNGSTKSNMCGSQQYYKISTSAPCTITWAMTPQSTADFDLYVKNSSGSCPSTGSYDCRPYYGTGSQETCSVSLPAGIYYALVEKYSGTGSYNIQVNTSNCGSSCTNECSSGQKRCNGSYSQTCGNYDSDSCYEWPSSTSGSGNTYCSYGCNSSTGQCYSALNVSVSPTNLTVNSGVTQTFTASPSGGTGSYSYNWSLSSYTNCTNSGSTSSTYSVTCTNTGSSQISRTVNVSVTSGSQTKTASTNLYVNPSTSCNSSSYTSCSSALSMSNGQTQSNMCGSNQFYKITTTQTCDIKWTLTPNNADFDLYAKYSSNSCPSTSNWDCRPYSGGTSVETCSQTQIPAGTYYVMVNKYSGTGTYSIKADLSNCGTVSADSCSNASWGPISWTNPYIYSTNGTDIVGKLETYDGYLKGYADFRWNSTKLSSLKNMFPAPTQVKFEFKRNQTRANETYDGIGSNCYDSWFYSNLPGNPIITNEGLEESDAGWDTICAAIYDVPCSLDVAQGRSCDEEYQIITSAVSQLSADTTYVVQWKLWVDKADGSQPTPWDASIEIGHTLPPWHECYLKKGGNWQVSSLASLSSYNSTLKSALLQDVQLEVYEETSDRTTENNMPVGDNGKKVIKQKYEFDSKQELLDFKSERDLETQEILKNSKNPSYNGAITFSRPLTKKELKKFVAKYDLSVQIVRYKSTVGGGDAPLYYIDSEEERIDEQQITKTLPKDAKNFKLIEKISAIKTSIPSKSVLLMQKNPDVFLIDIGPKEKYLNENAVAPIDNIAYEVEKFYR